MQPDESAEVPHSSVMYLILLGCVLALSNLLLRLAGLSAGRLPSMLAPAARPASAPLTSVPPPPGPDSVVIKKHHLVSVLVPVLLLLVLLTAAVAVFVYRHRRLRHRFLAFVSTHYSARPPAARFTNGDGLGKA